MGVGHPHQVEGAVGERLHDREHLGRVDGEHDGDGLTAGGQPARAGDSRDHDVAEHQSRDGQVHTLRAASDGLVVGRHVEVDDVPAAQVGRQVPVADGDRDIAALHLLARSGERVVRQQLAGPDTAQHHIADRGRPGEVAPTGPEEPHLGQCHVAGRDHGARRQRVGR